MRNVFLLLIITLASFNSFACLSSYQYKVFPIGFKGDTIVSVDFDIYRSEYSQGVKLGVVPKDSSKTMRDEYYTIKCYKVLYTFDQKEISRDSIETRYAPNKNYRDTIQAMYSKILEDVLYTDFTVELFNATYLSFCNFNQTCDTLTYKYDTVKALPYFLYNGEKYYTSFGTDSTSHVLATKKSLENYSVNSIRIYTSFSFSIVIVQLSNFQEKETANGNIPEHTEYLPPKPYTCIAEATYFEPVVHHGFGFDVFFITQ